MNIMTYRVSQSVSEIVIQGYTDSIEDVVIHQAMCNRVDSALRPGWYWLGSCEQVIDCFDHCEISGEWGLIYIVKAAKND